MMTMRNSEVFFFGSFSGRVHTAIIHALGTRFAPANLVTFQIPSAKHKNQWYTASRTSQGRLVACMQYGRRSVGEHSLLQT